MTGRQWRGIGRHLCCRAATVARLRATPEVLLPLLRCFPRPSPPLADLQLRTDDLRCPFWHVLVSVLLAAEAAEAGSWLLGMGFALHPVQTCVGSVFPPPPPQSRWSCRGSCPCCLSALCPHHSAVLCPVLPRQFVWFHLTVFSCLPKAGSVCLGANPWLAPALVGA